MECLCTLHSWAQPTRTPEDIGMLHEDEFWGRISGIVGSPSPDLWGWRGKCTTLHHSHGSLDKPRWLTRVATQWVPADCEPVCSEFSAPVPLPKCFGFSAGIMLSLCLALPQPQGHSSCQWLWNGMEVMTESYSVLPQMWIECRLLSSFCGGGRVSQATLTPSASRVGTCSDDQWRSGQGSSLGRAPRKGWQRWAAMGAGILLFSEALLWWMAGQPAQTTQRWPRCWSMSPLTPHWAVNWGRSKAQETGLSGTGGGGVISC